MTQVAIKYAPVVKPWHEWYYNWRWLQAYYWHQKQGATPEEAYECADYECSIDAISGLWSGDYSGVERAENRKDWIGL